MKKTLRKFLILPLCMLTACTFLLAGGFCTSAHANVLSSARDSNVHHNAVGGGCGLTYLQNDVSAYACVSTNWFTEVHGSMRVSFPRSSSWRSCSIMFAVRNLGTGVGAYSGMVSCLDDVRRGVTSNVYQSPYDVGGYWLSTYWVEARISYGYGSVANFFTANSPATTI